MSIVSEEDKTEGWIRDFQEFIDKFSNANFNIAIENLKSYNVVIAKYQLNEDSPNKFEANVSNYFRAKNVVKHLIDTNPGKITDITPAGLNQDYASILIYAI